jgi:hypothetical protein
VHKQLSAEEKYILSGSKGVAIWAESRCYSGAWSPFKSAVFLLHNDEKTVSNLMEDQTHRKD